MCERMYRYLLWFHSSTFLLQVPAFVIADDDLLRIAGSGIWLGLFTVALATITTEIRSCSAETVLSERLLASAA